MYINTIPQTILKIPNKKHIFTFKISKKRVCTVIARINEILQTFQKFYISFVKILSKSIATMQAWELQGLLLKFNNVAYINFLTENIYNEFFNFYYLMLIIVKNTINK